MTTRASIVRALAQDAINKNIKPIIVSGFPIESYEAIYNFNNCLFALGVIENYNVPYNIDYFLYIINYERIYALLTEDKEAVLSPTGASTTGSSEESLNFYLSAMQAVEYKKYEIFIDGGNYYKEILDHDYTDTTMYKLKINYAQTQLIPPIITQKVVYAFYYNINSILIPLRDVSTLFNSADIPTDVKTWSDKLKTTDYTINFFNSGT